MKTKIHYIGLTTLIVFISCTRITIGQNNYLISAVNSNNELSDKLELTEKNKNITVNKEPSLDFYNSIRTSSSTQDNLYTTQELLLAIYVNQMPRNIVDIVIKKDNELYISQDTIVQLNIKYDELKKITYYKKPYYKLSDKNITYSIRQATSILDIYAKPEAFISTIIEPESIWHKPKIPGMGAYINYDLIYKHTRAPKTNGLDGLINTTFFNKQHILTSDFRTSIITRNQIKTEQDRIENLNFNKDNKKFTRLETKYIRDFPEQMLTLTMGDARSFADLWGSPLLFGGIQIATNFTLQPGFVYYPLPDITGEANIPSAIDLYLNDVNRVRKNVQEGPFEIQEIPSISGGGEIRVIQKDLLGREKIYTIPYYLSSFALKPGVKQYSISTGALRQNFGIQSNQYKDFVVIGNYKEGISKDFTYSLRAEVKKKQMAAGLRTTWTKPKLGEINLVTVSSFQNQEQSGPGLLAKAIYINQFKYFNLNISVDTKTKKYIELGNDPKELPYRASLQAFLGIPLYYHNSLALSYIARDNRLKESESLLSINYNHNIKNAVSINLTSQVDFNNLNRKMVFINFIKPFAKQNITTSLSTNIENDEKPRYIFNLNKNIENYTGYGYYLRASNKHNLDILADVKYDSQYNSLQAEYNHLDNEHNFRLSARGGVAYFDKNIFFTRTIRDSFVVVDTNNTPDVDIYHNNRIITKSNSYGKAIIPQLNSYNINTIHIDPSQLPLSTKFDDTSFELIPYRKSGSLIKFKLEKNHSVIFKLVDKKKMPMLTGAHLTDSKDNLLTLIGLNGYVYLNVKPQDIRNKLKVQSTTNQCEFILPLDKIDDETIQTDLGEIICG